MSHLSAFKTLEGEPRYLAAYDAALKRWPVPYDEIDIPTRFGTTHVVVSGPKKCAAVGALARVYGVVGHVVAQRDPFQPGLSGLRHRQNGASVCEARLVASSPFGPPGAPGEVNRRPAFGQGGERGQPEIDGHRFEAAGFGTRDQPGATIAASGLNRTP